MRSELKFSKVPRRQLQYMHVRMTTDDDPSSGENDPTESTEQNSSSSSNTPTEEPAVTKKKKIKSNSLTKNISVVVPLLFKFTVVLMIKFLTDVVVYPSLFLYRLAGRGKRKIIQLFDGSASVSNIEPNGSAK